MTSANFSGAPQIISNEKARSKLSVIADAFLMHDRDIARRLDDSVEVMTKQGPMVLRRARGQVPETLTLPEGFDDAPQVVAFGGQIKSALCLVKNGEALLGHHLGDLDDAETRDAFLRADQDYAALIDHTPELAACDRHPDFFSTRHADTTGLPVVQVQHHHAHLASCLAENAWPLHGPPVAGIILDGTGYGADGSIWGGEVLIGGYKSYERVTHLHPAPLAGGDAAMLEPWRNLLVRLDQAGLHDIAEEILAEFPIETLRQAVAKGINAPLSSSVGRLFDAFAASLGLSMHSQSYEGEAAMLLEALAYQGQDAGEPYPLGAELDPSALFLAWAQDRINGVPSSVMAWRFHAGLARAFADAVKPLAKTGDISAVALSGGCMQNILLRDLLIAELDGIEVLCHSKMPANDGGLALGQALAAIAINSGS
jgi:hydrogenase maturation protein HypF